METWSSSCSRNNRRRNWALQVDIWTPAGVRLRATLPTRLGNFFWTCRKVTRMAQVKPIPEGFHTLTPHIICKGAAEAIDWYKKAFGAVELSRSSMPGSNLLIHSLVRIGDSL